MSIEIFGFQMETVKLKGFSNVAAGFLLMLVPTHPPHYHY